MNASVLLPTFKTFFSTSSPFGCEGIPAGVHNNWGVFKFCRFFFIYFFSIVQDSIKNFLLMIIYYIRTKIPQIFRPPFSIHSPSSVSWLKFNDSLAVLVLPHMLGLPQKLILLLLFYYYYFLSIDVNWYIRDLLQEGFKRKEKKKDNNLAYLKKL
jgi:hypothetical protein